MLGKKKQKRGRIRTGGSHLSIGKLGSENREYDGGEDGRHEGERVEEREERGWMAETDHHKGVAFILVGNQTGA